LGKDQNLTLLAQKRTGCPSTPIQGQPSLHDDCSYIDIMWCVKNFAQKMNHIHSLRVDFGLFMTLF